MGLREYKKTTPPDPSIKKKDYIENKEVDYNQHLQYQRNLDMFAKTKQRVLYPTTRTLYEHIRNVCIDHVKNHPQYPKFVWKPKICDVGCGGGFGSYIMSQEADWVWGIDASKENINWCKEVFEKHKNNIYYSPQLTFEVIDVLDEPREIQAFDIVACIEIIEHIDDYQKLIDFTKRLCKKDKSGSYIKPPDATIVYFSSPNRNFYKLGKDSPKNKFHVREWTAAELYDILIKNFEHITLMDCFGKLHDLDTDINVVLFKCEVPIIQPH